MQYFEIPLNSHCLVMHASILYHLLCKFGHKKSCKTPTEGFSFSSLNVPLLVCRVLNNGLLSIYDMLLELMRQHTFETQRQAYQ